MRECSLALVVILSSFITAGRAYYFSPSQSHDTQAADASQVWQIKLLSKLMTADPSGVPAIGCRP